MIDDVFTVAAWILVILMALIIGALWKNKGLKAGLTLIAGGIALLLIYVLIGYAGVLIDRKFDLGNALLLIDTRYGSSVIIGGYAILLGGVITVARGLRPGAVANDENGKNTE